MPKTDKIVINTGPILALIAGLGNLNVLNSLYKRVVVPYEVCEEINEHAMPMRVRVLLSIKGDVPLKERGIVPKNPGAFVIFKKEFDKARKGKVGVFFVGQDYNPNLLMKYREIPGI